VVGTHTKELKSWGFWLFLGQRLSRATASLEYFLRPLSSSGDISLCPAWAPFSYTKMEAPM